MTRPLCDGLHLSLYTHVDARAAAHDTGLRHDHNMTLWRKTGRRIDMLRHWEFERFSGLKHHALSFPDAGAAKAFIAGRLGEMGVSLSDVLTFAGTPGLDDPRDVSADLPDPDWPYHNLCHLHSSMLLDTGIFARGAMLSLALDGGPDNVLDPSVHAKPHYLGAVSRGGAVDIFPVASPAPLWAMMHQRFAMTEGALMALGSAVSIRPLIAPPAPPPVFGVADQGAAGAWFDRLAAEVEAMEATDEGVLFRSPDPRFSLRENRIAMVVQLVHAASLRGLERTVDAALRRFGLAAADTHLSMSGGYALNCPANSHLMRRYGFKSFIAPPAVNDGGLSIGIGLHHFRTRMGAFDFRFPGALRGAPDDGVPRVRARPAWRAHIADDDPATPQGVAADIARAPVLWFDGGAEVGPRALGARSILADPRSMAARDTLNEIKGREWWRPVAPIVLAHAAQDWFAGAAPSPYMLRTFALRPDKAALVPAIGHLDGTARVQTLGAGDAPRLHAAITAFAALTGVPMVCNTSLNDKGEPIVQRLEEALNFALRKGVGIVYANGRRLVLRDHARFAATGPARRPALAAMIAGRDAAARARTNPFGLTRRELMVLAHNPRLARHDPGSAEGAKKLRRRIAEILRRYGDRADFRALDLWHFHEHDHDAILGRMQDERVLEGAGHDL